MPEKEAREGKGRSLCECGRRGHSLCLHSAAAGAACFPRGLLCQALLRHLVLQPQSSPRLLLQPAGSGQALGNPEVTCALHMASRVLVVVGGSVSAGPLVTFCLWSLSCPGLCWLEFITKLCRFSCDESKVKSCHSPVPPTVACKAPPPRGCFGTPQTCPNPDFATAWLLPAPAYRVSFAVGSHCCLWLTQAFYVVSISQGTLVVSPWGAAQPPAVTHACSPDGMGKRTGRVKGRKLLGCDKDSLTGKATLACTLRLPCPPPQLPSDCRRHRTSLSVLPARPDSMQVLLGLILSDAISVAGCTGDSCPACCRPPCWCCPASPSPFSPAAGFCIFPPAA